MSAAAPTHVSCSPRDVTIPLLGAGYRVVATTLLPIGDDTLRYGSGDAGTTVMADARFHKTLGEAARQLNLALHPVSSKSTPLYMAGDVEGHLGR